MIISIFVAFVTSTSNNSNIYTTFAFKGEVKGWAANNVEANAKIIKALCLPFISIIQAIGNPSVDYFSLDIEGVELDVLKTIPWDRVDIKVNVQIKHF